MALIFIAKSDGLDLDTDWRLRHDLENMGKQIDISCDVEKQITDRINKMSPKCFIRLKYPNF